MMEDKIEATKKKKNSKTMNEQSLMSEIRTK